MFALSFCCLFSVLVIDFVNVLNYSILLFLFLILDPVSLLLFLFFPLMLRVGIVLCSLSLFVDLLCFCFGFLNLSCFTVMILLVVCVFVLCSFSCVRCACVVIVSFCFFVRCS